MKKSKFSEATIRRHWHRRRRDARDPPHQAATRRPHARL